MEKEMYKVLFVGLGGVGQRHLRNLKKLMGDHIEVYAYRKRREQFVLNDELKIQPGICLEQVYSLKCVETLQEAYECGVQIVFICNPTSMHMEILKSALRAGCDVFLEKPVSDNLGHVEEMEDYLRQHSNRVFVGYQNRYHPCIVKTKELLEKKVIGEVLSVQAEIGECVKNWHKYEHYSRMYACRKDLGGGVVVTQIHELDYLYYLFGMPKKVYAVGGQISSLEIDVEDVVDILMNYPVEGREIPISVHEDYLQTPACRTCKILGTKGKIEFDLLSAKINLYGEHGNVEYQEKFEFNRNDMFMEELKDFLDSVAGRKEVFISFEQGVKSLKIAMAVKESLYSGKIVTI